MLYCKECKCLENQNEKGVCPHCGKPLKVPEESDKILLVSGQEIEILNLCSKLSEYDIEFEENTKEKSVLSYKARGFRGLADIYVRYKQYNAAKVLAEQSGFTFPETPGAAVKQKESVQDHSFVGTKTGNNEQAKEESKKSKAGKILLYALVIAAVIAVVFLTDAFTGAIRGIFSR